MQATPVWSGPRRIGFLVLAVFLLFNALPELWQVVPVVGMVMHEGYEWLWAPVLQWVGANVLGIDRPIAYVMNGSGDTTWHWVRAFCVVVLALVGGTTWAVLDHRRGHYAGLQRWLHVLTRYALGASMLMYGVIKVFKSQFPFPHLGALTTTYGDSSPMGLAWRFMGYSDGYNLFTGGAEVLAGALLLWRRTATLGALVAIGVTANVLALNLCFDIPVKLYSATLLVMALYLAGSDGRLLDFVRNRATAPVEYPPHVTRRWARWTRVGLKSVFVGLMALTAIEVQAMTRYGEAAEKPRLYGLYAVDGFVCNGEERPPLLTDGLRWRELIIERWWAVLRRMPGNERESMDFEIDEEKRTITLTHAREGQEPRDWTMQYEETAEGLVLRGEFEGDDLVVTLKRVDHTQMLLVSRGFRWINDAPFNR